VAETPARELTRLDNHNPDRPPVVVHTLDGEPVEIKGDFRFVRVVTGSEWTEKKRIVKRPFRAALVDGDTLTWQSRGAERDSVSVDKVTRLEIVQRDGDRTAVVMLFSVAGAVAGTLLYAYLDRQQDDHNMACGACALAIGAPIGVGLSLLITIPATKYY
jgi:hypothetical protein